MGNIKGLTTMTTMTTMTPNIASALTPLLKTTTPPPGGPSKFETIGLPILLLFVVLFIFFLVHAAMTWLPESEWWRRLTENYNHVDEDEKDKASFLLKRKHSLRRKLKGYKDSSKAYGHDGRGGTSTGEVSKDDFDYDPRTNVTTEVKDKKGPSPKPPSSRSSIEEEPTNSQPLNVAHFHNQAFDNDLNNDQNEEDLRDNDDLEVPPVMMRNKRSLYRDKNNRRSAELYSRFSLPPLNKKENLPEESVEVHDDRHSYNHPVPPKRKKHRYPEGHIPQQGHRHTEGHMPQGHRYTEGHIPQQGHRYTEGHIPQQRAHQIDRSHLNASANDLRINDLHGYDKHMTRSVDDIRIQGHPHELSVHPSMTRSFDDLRDSNDVELGPIRSSNNDLELGPIRSGNQHNYEPRVRSHDRRYVDDHVTEGSHVVDVVQVHVQNEKPNRDYHRQVKSQPKPVQATQMSRMPERQSYSSQSHIIGHAALSPDTPSGLVLNSTNRGAASDYRGSAHV